MTDLKYIKKINDNLAELIKLLDSMVDHMHELDSTLKDVERILKK